MSTRSTRSPPARSWRRTQRRAAAVRRSPPTSAAAVSKTNCTCARRRRRRPRTSRCSAVHRGAPSEPPDTRANPTRSEPLPFVGRRAELARLGVDWNSVRDGNTRAVVITGEPGIGKTRLATEITDATRRDGALALWGACRRRRRAPLSAVRRAPGTTREGSPVAHDVARRAAAVITTLVPELMEQPAPVSPASEDNARTRLFRAVQRGARRRRERTGGDRARRSAVCRRRRADAAASPGAGTGRAALSPGDHRPRTPGSRRWRRWPTSTTDCRPRPSTSTGSRSTISSRCSTRPR